MSEMCPTDPIGSLAGGFTGRRHMWAATGTAIGCDNCEAVIAWDAFNYWWSLRILADLRHLCPTTDEVHERMTTLGAGYRTWKAAGGITTPA